MVLKLASMIWWKLALFFDDWPWRLVTLVNPNASRDAKYECACRVFNEHECCLDPDLTLKAL
eukprot:14934198-Alexandrium_andersonii.AAC.1